MKKPAKQYNSRLPARTANPWVDTVCEKRRRHNLKNYMCQDCPYVYLEEYWDESAIRRRWRFIGGVR